MQEYVVRIAQEGEGCNEGERERTRTGMIMPFKPLTISFDNIKYFVPMPSGMQALGATEGRLQLLSGVKGAFRSGVLTTLVGMSGI